MPQAKIATLYEAASQIRPARVRGPGWLALEKRLENGLRNYWYAIVPSDDLGAAPIGIRRMGEDLVVWRDGAGKARVFRDYCAHRGARLSLGKVVDGTLRCVYHGWTYEGSGQCVAIPSEGGPCPLAKDVLARAYATEEHGGLVFAYISEDGRQPDVPCPNPYELEDPAWNGFIVRHNWDNVPWFRMLENLTDPIHGPFLHSGTFTLSRTKTEKDVIQIEPREDSIFISREGQKLVNFDYTEYHFPNWFRLDIPYPWSAGPGGPMRILVFVTPIDAGRTQSYMVRKRQIAGWRWWVWWSLWQLRLRRAMWGVMDGDEMVLLSQRGTDCIEDEYLAQSDLGIIRMRQMFAAELDRRDGARAHAAE